MSERLSQQISAFREAMVRWRSGVTLEPEAVDAFDELFESWERAARQLEGAPPEIAAELDDVEDLATDIAEQLKAIGELTQKINGYAARLRAAPGLRFKGV